MSGVQYHEILIVTGQQQSSLVQAASLAAVPGGVCMGEHATDCKVYDEPAQYGAVMQLFSTLLYIDVSKVL